MTVPRLKKRRDFLRVASFGLKRVTSTMVVQACPLAEGREVGAIGFTASKKVGNAVHRNRARRRLRAAVEEVIGRQVLPMDLVIIARSCVINCPYSQMLQDMQFAVSKLITKVKNPSP